MKSNEIVSLRTALRYLAKGDSRAKKIRLAAILAVSALPAVLLGLVLASLLM